jgi:hypothetical protein
MIFIPFGRFGLRIDGLYPHQFHQPLNSFAVNRMNMIEISIKNAILLSVLSVS